VPTLINPPGSGKNFIPICLKTSFVSGTTTIGSVLIAETASVVTPVGVGLAILTATAVAGKNVKRGVAGTASVMIWSPTTNTFTAAPTVIAATRINLGAAAPTGPGAYQEDFEGGLVIVPGHALSIVYSVTSSTSLWQTTLFGLEVPA
jgi:hypothetical protein